MFLHLFSTGALGISQVLDFVCRFIHLFIFVNIGEKSSHTYKDSPIEYHMPKILRSWMQISFFPNQGSLSNCKLSHCLSGQVGGVGVLSFSLVRWLSERWEGGSLQAGWVRMALLSVGFYALSCCISSFIMLWLLLIFYCI